MTFKHLLFATPFVLSFHAAQAALTKSVSCGHGRTVKNAQCCSLFTVLDDIQKNMFEGGKCNDVAHEALRLTFHDAVGHSSSGRARGGGADGSIMTFAEVETKYHANVGLDEIVNIEAPFAKFHNMTPGDFIHFAGAVAVTNCPGAPSLSYSLGRPIAKGPADDSLVPAPFDTMDKIFDRMQDALGFSPVETVWALAAHSIGSASDVDPSVPRAPFDSTPGIFDAQFFVETQLRGTLWPGRGGIQGEAEAPIKGEMRLQSDHDMARDSRSACEWQSFVTDHAKLQNRFQFAMETIAVAGQDTTKMVDCSEVIPQPPPLPLQYLAFPSVLPLFMSQTDIEQACATTPFPHIAAIGPRSVSPVSVAHTNPPGH